MPTLKNYRLLISHSWRYNNEYETVVNWLNINSNFTWSNHSISADNPKDARTEKEIKEAITNQINGCSAVVVISGLYAKYSKWIDWEISEAKRLSKPIIGLKPWGQEKIPTNISENAIEMVGWNSSSLIQSIRDYAN